MEVEETSDRCFKGGEEEREPQLVHPPTPMSSDGGGWCFDCNICLDFAVEPVVTLCGHLYCWPCIYKWLHQPERPSQHRCPVCNSPLSQRALVPLYGRGHGTKRLEGVPPRPRSAHRDRDRDRAESNIDLGPPVFRHWPQNSHLDRPRASTLRPPTEARVTRSTAGRLAMSAFPWVFGNRETGAYYLSPYDLVSQEMQVERLLHLIWVFCCCFALLCFIFF